MTYGKELKALRIKRGMRLRGLAKEAGISSSYLSQIEQEKVPPPSAETIERIAGVLKAEGDVMALEAGKIPIWIKTLLIAFPDACIEKLKEMLNEKNL